MGRWFESIRAHQYPSWGHWIASRSVLCQEILTHTQPTTCEPPSLGGDHFVRYSHGIFAQSGLNVLVSERALRRLRITLVHRDKPSRQARTKRMQTESLTLGYFD